MRRVVPRYLRPVLRPVFDPPDLTQDVWCALFVRVLPQRYFAGPAQFLRCLTAMTRNTVCNLYRDQVLRQKPPRSKPSTKFPAETRASFFGQVIV